MNTALPSAASLALEDIITDADLQAYHAAERRLAAAIPQAVAAGHSGNMIAQRLTGIFGQQAIKDYATAVRTSATVGDALKAAGLGEEVSVSVSGLGGSSGCWVELKEPHTMRPERREALSEEIRRALLPYLLTFSPALDSNLTEGFGALVVKVRARR